MSGSAKITRSKFENLWREIKADIRKQHDLYVNNLVGDVKVNPRVFLQVHVYKQADKSYPMHFPVEKEEWKWNCTVRIREGGRI